MYSALSPRIKVPLLNSNDHRSFARSRSLLPNDRHSSFFFLAFLLFYIEHFNVFDNPDVISLYMGGSWTGGSSFNPGPLAITCCGFLLFIVLFAKRRWFLNNESGLTACCAMIVCAPLLWAVEARFPQLMVLGYVGLGLFAFGHLCFLPAMVKNLAVLGPTRSLTTFALLLACRALIEPVVGNLPAVFLEVFIAISPIAMLACIRCAEKAEPIHIDIRRDAKAHFPKVLFITLVTSGVLAGLFTELSLGSFTRPVAASTAEAFIAAFLIVFLLASPKINFNRLFYLIGIPLMAYGIALFIANDPYQKLAGFLIFSFGYDFLYAALWSLYSYLIRYSTFNYFWLVITAAFGTFLGKTLCTVCIELLKLNASLAEYIPLVSITIVFVAMLIAIMFYGQNNMKTGWGSITPQDDPFASDALERNCNDIASISELTAREKDVLLLLSKGNNSKTIGEKLCISVGTARTHVKHVYNKLGVHSQQELIDLVEKNGQYLQPRKREDGHA